MTTRILDKWYPTYEWEEDEQVWFVEHYVGGEDAYIHDDLREYPTKEQAQARADELNKERQIHTYGELYNV